MACIIFNCYHFLVFFFVFLSSQFQIDLLNDSNIILYHYLHLVMWLHLFLHFFLLKDKLIFFYYYLHLCCFFNLIKLYIMFETAEIFSIDPIFKISYFNTITLFCNHWTWVLVFDHLLNYLKHPSKESLYSFVIFAIVNTAFLVKPMSVPKHLIAISFFMILHNLVNQIVV